MNKIFIGIGAVVVVIVLVVVFSGGENKESPEAMVSASPTVSASAMMEKKEEGAMMEKKEGEAMAKKGSYEAYGAEKLAWASTGKVVLFFRASWCPSCRALDADIKSNLGAIPAGTTILDVDYDNSTAMKQKYGVTTQHTLVQVDSKGELISKWSGSPTLAELLTKIK